MEMHTGIEIPEASNQKRSSVKNDSIPSDDIETEMLPQPPSTKVTGVWKTLSPLHNQLERIKREEESSDRKALLFCGCCCDVVKGSIVVNILQICMVTLFFAFRLTDNPRFVIYEKDENRSAIQEFFDPLGVVGLTWTALMIAVGCIAIAGAWKFHKTTVLFAAICYCIDIVLKLLISASANLIGSCLCCYAQIHLFVELNSGRMTRDNYINERKCCCY